VVVSAVAVAGAMCPGTAGAAGSTIAGAARMAESSSAGAGRVGAVVPAPRFVASATAGTGRIIIDWPAAGPPPLVAGATVAATLSHLGMAVLDVPDVAAALTAYRDVPGVAWAEADRPFAAAGTPDVAPVAAGTPDDPLFPEQWNLQSGPDAARQSIDWAAAYPQAQGSGALVAVLDTGFETGGSDQPANIRTDLARSFVPGTTTAADDNGHGTFVTDIIAEATDNAAGTAGIAPGAGIVPVKVLGADGTGDLSIVAEGIDYATSIGATVINLSLAGEPSAAICAAVARAATSAIVVAATGNDATAQTTHGLDYPAACPGVFAVGSVAYDGTRPSYANTGCGIAVVAPGGDDLDLTQPGVPGSDWILEQGFDTTTGTFAYYQEEGTSMSAAEVAGEAALLFGLGADVTTVRRLIVGTARPDGPPAMSELFGAGTVDVGAAVGDLRSGTPVALPDRGYQLATATGEAVSDGDPCAGSGTTSVGRPARPIVGEAATPDGRGSWLVASDGGIFSLGDARFYGSTGAVPLNQPIVGMAATPTGNGYWLVARDGGIFTFGDARFDGSTAGRRLAGPIVGMAATSSGNGYWLAGADGSVYAFGGAAPLGGTTAGPVVAIATEASG